MLYGEEKTLVVQTLLHIDISTNWRSLGRWIQRQYACRGRTRVEYVQQVRRPSFHSRFFDSQRQASVLWSESERTKYLLPMIRAVP